MAADLFSALAPPPPAPATPPPAPPVSQAFKKALKAVPPLIVEGHLVFRCAMCRKTAQFGFGRDMRRDDLGIWFCGEHKDLGQ